MPTKTRKQGVCSECFRTGHNRASCPVLYLSILKIGTHLECSTVIGAEPRNIRMRCDCGAEYVRSWSHVSRYERCGHRLTCGRCRIRHGGRGSDKRMAAKLELVRELISDDSLLRDPDGSLARLRWIFRVEAPAAPDPRQQKLFVQE